MAACGRTGDDMFCACGCGGDDSRCEVWQRAYNTEEEVPDSHTCCKVFKYADNLAKPKHWQQYADQHMDKAMRRTVTITADFTMVCTTQEQINAFEKKVRKELALQFNDILQGLEVVCVVPPV